jgi:UbiD family decarboxylase
MAYDDLRAFLKALDEQGQLLRITDDVMPEPDIAVAANAAPRLGDNASAGMRPLYTTMTAEIARHGAGNFEGPNVPVRPAVQNRGQS